MSEESPSKSKFIDDLSLAFKHKYICTCGCWWWGPERESDTEDAICQKCELEYEAMIKSSL